MSSLKPIGLLALVVVGCGSSSGQSQAPGPTSIDETAINATGVVIVADHCKRMSKEASRQAEATLNRLINHCNTVLTQPSTFRIVLEPGGTISFARAGSRSADAGSDEIPMCVVTQKLQHHIRLSAPCPIDVRFEPASIAPR